MCPVLFPQNRLQTKLCAQTFYTVYRKSQKNYIIHNMLHIYAFIFQKVKSHINQGMYPEDENSFEKR